MPTDTEIAQKFWKSLKSDRVTMLALAGVEDGHSQPMSAQLLEEDEENGGPVWFFTAKDTGLARETGKSHRAQMHFSAKGHDLFAAVHGTLSAVDDPAIVERLWNPFIAAWFEGKTDPKLRLLRFDPEHGQIWLNENSLLAGVRMMLGRDPKKDYRDKVANVPLGPH